MKTKSLINKKAAASISALAVSATLAIGMVGCAPADTSSASDASSSATTQEESSAADAAPTSDSVASSAASTASDTAQSASTSNGNAPAATEAKITEDQALTKALNQANLKKSQVQVVKNYLETDDGVLMYEIEFTGPNNMEYEVEVDANTGNILSYDSEIRDND